MEIVAASATGGVVPSVIAAAMAAPAQVSKKGADTAQANAEPQPAEKSWLKRKFGKKKSVEEEVVVIEESMPATKKPSEPAVEVASIDVVEEPKKESWFKRKFRKKQQPAEVVVVEEEIPATKPAAKPPKPAPKPAATVASNDSLSDNNGDPSYRNQNSTDARSAMLSQPASSDDTGSLADQMKVSPSQDDGGDDDVQVGVDKERSFVGRVLYRYW